MLGDYPDILNLLHPGVGELLIPGHTNKHHHMMNRNSVKFIIERI